jgi:threonine synthase
MSNKQCLLVKYRDFLPVTPQTPIITIGEGDTPLVRSQRLEREIGCGELYFKLEGCNPTGSFKDRGMVVAVAKAVEAGNSAIICASTGNTSASAAAYGAVCGLTVFVVVPKGNIALGKLAQAIVYGAKIIAINDNFDKALQLVRALTEKHPIALVNSINPNRIEGQKTASFEIVDALGGAPDYLFIPLGNAGNITAYWRGFVHYKEAGKAKNAPKMMGFEAEGSAAIVRGTVIPNPKTVASAIRIGNPASWKNAVSARDESEGAIDYVTDEEIMSAYKLLAVKEGIFGEPASAASVAGLIKKAKSGIDFSEEKVVCVITGTGLKDPDTALRSAHTLPEIPADLESIEKVIIKG